jgi:hypothetical protein
VATVKLHESDSDRKSAAGESLTNTFDIETEDGRRITSKPSLKVREEMFLSEVLGADTRLNPVWVLWATVACCVSQIDGEAVRMPTSKLQVEALVERIGDEAMRALLVRYRANSEAREARVLARAKN